MTEADPDQTGPGDAAAALDQLWRTEEELVRALLDDIRTLRGTTAPGKGQGDEPMPADDPVPQDDPWAASPFDAEPQDAVNRVFDSLAEPAAAMDSWEVLPSGGPAAHNAQGDAPLDDILADTGNSPPAVADWPPDPRYDVSGVVEEQAARSGDPLEENAGAGHAIATLQAIDDETGDCFCYEIVDADGRPCDHQAYEIVGHELRQRGDGAADGLSADEPVLLRMTNAAGDARILEFDRASGQLIDCGRDTT